MGSGIRVIDIMSHKVVTATPNMTVSEVAKLMNKHRIGGVPVCEGNKFVGLITERDIMLRVIALNRKPSSLRVKQVMQSKPRVVTEKFEDLTTVTRKFVDHEVSRIPVLDGNKIVGVVTHKDVVRHAPALLDLFIEKLKVSTQGKPEHPEAFGTCESCDNTGHLHFLNESFVCDECIN
tara:strand:+ start:1658 stop:2191 length:534 start_codon:yes stop_codon:yes gene_type:complete